jgi:hypothetical protein
LSSPLILKLLLIAAEEGERQSPIDVIVADTVEDPTLTPVLPMFGKGQELRYNKSIVRDDAAIHLFFFEL